MLVRTSEANQCEKKGRGIDAETKSQSGVLYQVSQLFAGVWRE